MQGNILNSSGVNMQSNAGKPKGQGKSGGARKGSVHLQTLEVKAAILRVFQELNHDDKYLKKLAEENTQLFISLIAKILPSTVDVDLDVTHKIDIGAAMKEADKRLATMNSYVDVTPDPVIDQSEEEPLYPEPRPRPTLNRIRNIRR